jgi:hypothetical protein
MYIFEACQPEDKERKERKKTAKGREEGSREVDVINSNINI